jgi:hypothetical protein
MVIRQWFALATKYPVRWLLLTAAFGAPVVITSYLGSPASALAGNGILVPVLNFASWMLFQALPFAIYRAATGDSAGLAISNTINRYRQVWRYIGLVIPWAFLLWAIAAVPAVALARIVGRPGAAKVAAVWGSLVMVLYEYVRLRLLAVPPMLAATGADRKTAARFSRRITRQADVTRVFLLIDGVPLAVASLLRLVLPEVTGFWLVTATSIVIACLSGILGAVLWTLKEDAGKQAAEEHNAAGKQA